jgi:hypothetical protein
MTETLVQKALAHGMTVRLDRYLLSDSSTEILHRPAGSYEMVLILDESNGSGGTTVPKASWYLGEGDYRRLHAAIKNVQDFRKVDKFLDDEVNSPEDAKKVAGFLDAF